MTMVTVRVKKANLLKKAVKARRVSKQKREGANLLFFVLILAAVSAG